MKQKDYDKSNAPRLLKPEEAESLLKDAKAASAWMRAEIMRRRSEISAKQDVKGKHPANSRISPPRLIR